MDALLTTGGNNTAADVRTVVQALWRHAKGPYSLNNAADVWWQSNVGDFTEVTVTGDQTVQENDGSLSIAFGGQTANDWNAFLKPVSFSIGDAWATRVSLISMYNTFIGVGLCFTDGTTGAANALVGHTQYESNPDPFVVGRHGTLTAMTNAPWIAAGRSVESDEIYFRLTYVAANTFRVEVSKDGLLYDNWDEADISMTMTPTHVGVAFTASVPFTLPALANIGPICKVA